MIETLTDKDFEEELGKHRISLVKVYASWCGPCKLVKSHFKKWSETYDVYNEVPVKYYEIENDKNRKFVEGYNVIALPSILFFVHGVHVFTLRGMTRAKVIEEMLQRTLDIKFEVKRNDDDTDNTTTTETT